MLRGAFLITTLYILKITNVIRTLLRPHKPQFLSTHCELLYISSIPGGKTIHSLFLFLIFSYANFYLLSYIFFKIDTEVMIGLPEQLSLIQLSFMDWQDLVLMINIVNERVYKHLQVVRVVPSLH